MHENIPDANPENSPSAAYPTAFAVPVMLGPTSLELFTRSDQQTERSIVMEMGIQP